MTSPDRSAADRDQATAVQEEQAHVTLLYERLAELRRDAERRRIDARYASDGTPAGRFNRDALQHRYSQELQMLTAAEDKLCFGRLDVASSAAAGVRADARVLPGGPDHEQEPEDPVRHIGRMGITDGTPERRELLIDWRAPSSAPFYTATALTPLGVRRRRHIRTRRDKVLSVADEYLQAIDPSDVLGAGALEQGGGARAGGAQGADPASDTALLEALNAPRTGRMGDIIETIQAEQDRIIRSPRPGVLVVQGGPGTGKTVVALHRAAFLLYTYRERLGSHGVLVIGPNQTFLDYIGQVLPALGESSVVLSTIGTLLPGIRVTREDRPSVVQLKGRLGMASVLDAALLDRQRMLKRVRTLRYEQGPLRLDRGLLARAQRRAWGSRLPHNRARSVFLKTVVEGLATQVAGRTGVRQLEDSDVRPDFTAIRADLVQDEVVAAALSDLWPALTPEQLVGDLLDSPDRLRFAAPSLSDAERALLHRTEPGWSEADIPLLDEAAELLGDPSPGDRARLAAERAERLAVAEESLAAMGSAAETQADAGIDFTIGMIDAEQLAEVDPEIVLAGSTADRASADREWTYGHVIVDEAQELSQMAWRSVMRRCPVQSMTLVGDIAQTSSPAGARTWNSAVRRHVHGRWRLEQLTVNYRTPREIMEVAEPVLAAIDPTLVPPTSIRDTAVPPWARRVPRSELAAAAADAVRDLRAEVGAGQVAVLMSGDKTAVLDGIRAVEPGVSSRAGLGKAVVVLDLHEAKGLEFDAVLVLEPAGIVAGSARGTGDLYVALTRATQRLGVLHSEPLPKELAGLRV